MHIDRRRRYDDPFPQTSEARRSREITIPGFRRKDAIILNSKFVKITGLPCTAKRNRSWSNKKSPCVNKFFFVCGRCFPVFLKLFRIFFIRTKSTFTLNGFCQIIHSSHFQAHDLVDFGILAVSITTGMSRVSSDELQKTADLKPSICAALNLKWSGPGFLDLASSMPLKAIIR